VKIGDVVVLKCGGPKMIVDGAPKTCPRDDCVTVHVTWIDAKGEVKFGRFPVDGLIVEQDA
jgi:uncharacterized protein YodC (DUF2158 family)